jgi:hypothetical protein
MPVWLASGGGERLGGVVAMGMPGLPGAMQGMGLGPMGQMQGARTRQLSCDRVTGMWFCVLVMLLR